MSNRSSSSSSSVESAPCEAVQHDYKSPPDDHAALRYTKSTLPPVIPTPRVTTYNLNSASHAPNTPAAVARRHNIDANITQLKKKTDIFLFQETHLPDLNATTFTFVLKGWSLFYSNGPNRRAGVIIAIAPGIAEHFHLKPNAEALSSPSVPTFPASERTRLGTAAIGHVLAVDLIPKDHIATTHPSWQVFNFYLTASRSADKKKEIEAASKMKPAAYTFLGGDFNFVEDPEDGHQLPLSKAAREVWQAFRTKRSLTEVVQPAHTYFFFDNKNDQQRSARIDRIYSSHSLPDLAIVNPSTHIPPVPYTSIRRQKSLLKTGKSHACPDHYPVALTYESTAPKAKRTKLIPKWLADTDIYQKTFYRMWKKGRDRSFKASARYKRTAFKAADRVLRGNRRINSEVSTLSGALAIQRMVNASKIDHDRLAFLLSNNCRLNLPLLWPSHEGVGGRCNQQPPPPAPLGPDSGVRRGAASPRRTEEAQLPRDQHCQEHQDPASLGQKAADPSQSYASCARRRRRG